MKIADKITISSRNKGQSLAESGSVLCSRGRPSVKLSPGDTLDQKYQIVRILGTGGMGSVYEAMNVRLGRRVAIKVMHKVRDQGDVARFEREARAAQIGSPYIVQVYDLGYTSDGAPYMVMEYLAGESLGERVHRQGKLKPSEMVPIARQILEALAAAHRAGIVHRDLKPDNVFLSRPEGENREIVKLVDFGISKLLSNSSQRDALSLTKTGVAVGTPHYMSPEQVQGKKELDGRSDLYSLGVMLYRCLSGHLPFNADEIAPLLMQVLMEVPTPLRELAPELDRELISMVTRSMARRPEDRFQTATEFLSVVVAWEESHSANLDAPLVPAGMTAATKTGAYGTAASWSSVTNQPVSSGSRFRTIALTGSLLIAGVVGALVAFKLWTTPTGTVETPTVESSAATANNAMVANTKSSTGDLPSVAVVPVNVPPGNVPSTGQSALPSAFRLGRSGVTSSPAQPPTPEGKTLPIVDVPNPLPSVVSSPIIAAAPFVVPPTPAVTQAPLAVIPPAIATVPAAGLPAAASPAISAKPANGANRHVIGDL
jgi:serine/threonine-protein kinase